MSVREVVSASRPLVGRDRELEQLYSLVDGIVQKGGALVVRGEAGISKSALLTAGGERARDQGVTVVATAGVLSEARLGFAGLHVGLLVAGGVAGAVGIVNPPKQTDAVGCAGGQLVGALRPAALLGDQPA